MSYYDYYQPEAYVPSTDTFIEKDAAINEEIDKCAIRPRKRSLSGDTIIVASVPYSMVSSLESYFDLILFVEENSQLNGRALRKLVNIQYQRNDFDFHRGCSSAW